MRSGRSAFFPCTLNLSWPVSIWSCVWLMSARNECKRHEFQFLLHTFIEATETPRRQLLVSSYSLSTSRPILKLSSWRTLVEVTGVDSLNNLWAPKESLLRGNHLHSKVLNTTFIWALFGVASMLFGRAMRTFQLHQFLELKNEPNRRLCWCEYVWKDSIVWEVLFHS